MRCPYLEELIVEVGRPSLERRSFPPVSRPRLDLGDTSVNPYCHAELMS